MSKRQRKWWHADPCSTQVDKRNAMNGQIGFKDFELENQRHSDLNLSSVSRKVFQYQNLSNLVIMQIFHFEPFLIFEWIEYARRSRNFA